MNIMSWNRGNTLSLVGRIRVNDLPQSGADLSISCAAVSDATPNIRIGPNPGVTTTAASRAQRWVASATWIDQANGVFRIVFSETQTAQWPDAVIFDVKVTGPLVGVVNSPTVRINVVGVIS